MITIDLFKASCWFDFAVVLDLVCRYDFRYVLLGCFVVGVILLMGFLLITCFGAFSVSCGALLLVV